jgi:hypothetical protein
MIKYILPLILISSMTFAKANPVDSINSHVNDNNLPSLLISSLTYEQNNPVDSIILENKNLKKIIKDLNTVFLRDIFEEKYNENYFTTTDLTTVNDIDTQKINNSNIIIRSLTITEKDTPFKSKCKKALDFNTNYLKLFSIKKVVLNQKYDSARVNQAVIDIDKLPHLENNSKLFDTRLKIKNELNNYLLRTCELKKKLDQLAKGNDQNNAIFKQKYTLLENKEEYKNYPYLVQVIKKVKNNVNQYSQDDLQPCELKPQTYKTQNLNEIPQKMENSIIEKK